MRVYICKWSKSVNNIGITSSNYNSPIHIYCSKFWWVLLCLWVVVIHATGNSYWRGRLSTVDLFIKIGYYVEKKNIVKVTPIFVQIERMHSWTWQKLNKIQSRPKLFAFINVNSKFFCSISVSFIFCKFWSCNSKSMAKHKKSISQLPSFGIKRSCSELVRKGSRLYWYFPFG